MATLSRKSIVLLVYSPLSLMAGGLRSVLVSASMVLDASSGQNDLR